MGVAWGWHEGGMRVVFTRQVEGQRPTFRGMMGKIGWAIVHFFVGVFFLAFFFQHYCSSFFFSCLFFTNVNPACSFRWRYACVCVCWMEPEGVGGGGKTIAVFS